MKIIYIPLSTINNVCDTGSPQWTHSYWVPVVMITIAIIAIIIVLKK